MQDELNKAIVEYKKRWAALIAGRRDKAFFEGLRPTAVAWKTEDLADFDRRYAALRDESDNIHLGWVNGRWLATFHLKQKLEWDIAVVKLMQRRPGSTDAVGLDHLDFYAPDSAGRLKEEPNLHWTSEINGDHCKWLSIWFDGTEAKLRGDTVLDVCAAEMLGIRDTILP